MKIVLFTDPFVKELLGELLKHLRVGHNLALCSGIVGNVEILM